MRNAIEAYIQSTIEGDLRLIADLPSGVLVERAFPYERPDFRYQVWIYEGASRDWSQDYIEDGTPAEVSMNGSTVWHITCRVTAVGQVDKLADNLRTLTRNVFRIVREMVDGPADAEDDAYGYWGYGNVGPFAAPEPLLGKQGTGRYLAGAQQVIPLTVRWQGQWAVGE